jgi:hypothetical protein
MTLDILSGGPVDLAVLSILFLSAGAWNNRRTGYSRSSRKAGWREWNSLISHSTSAGGSGPRAVSRPLVPEPPVYSDSVDEAGIYLIQSGGPLHPGKKGRETREIKGMPLKNALRSYLIAFISVLAAAMLAKGTILLTGSVPMGFFVVAVIVSAGRGIREGLLATALSLSVMNYVFRGQVSISTATHSTLALFLVIGIATNLVFYKLHLRNAAVTRAKAELETVNHKLRNHVKSLAEANSMLAEQKITLSQAHEDLRFLSRRLANSMQAPLRTISATTERLVRSNVVKFDASFTQASGELIKDEIRRMDTLVADLAHAC